MTAELTIGTVAGDHGTNAVLDARRFNRHTFWCGQSGSGKTYALGVVLEQLLLETDLPMLILDPNGDFVRLSEPRPDTDPAVAAELASLDIRVFRSPVGDAEPLQVRYLDMSSAAKAALLHLDPIADAEEYNVLLRFDERRDDFEHEAFDSQLIVEQLRSSPDPGQIRLSYRIENLEVLKWDLWSRGAASVVDVVADRPRATVMDLGGFAHPSESKVAALALLEDLWQRREERRPILIVIDEAHNLCSPAPETDVERALTRLLLHIAAEGRKFGLWLLLSTQRPGKIHPNVLSQCDNLGLMRINSPRDLTELAEVFGFAGDDLIQQASGFPQGQGMFAGGFISEPSFVQMGRRLTEEAGGDVMVPIPGAGGEQA